MPSSIKDSVALITGASRGIGEHCALALAAEGCHLALVARSLRGLQRTVSSCERLGVRVLPLAADLADMRVMPDVVQRCVGELGGLNILVSNAGVCFEGPPAQAELSHWDEMLDVNLRGAMHLTRHALPHIAAGMQRVKHGALLYVASMAGIRTYAGGAAYCATKYGLVGFASGLWDDVAELGIKVSAVCPSWVNTDMAADSGLDRAMMIQPEDVAALVRLVATWPDTSCPKMLQVMPQRWPRRV